MRRPFLFFLSPLVSAALAQISLNVTRSDSPATWNILSLTCEHISGSSPPMFFRGTERVDVPDPTSFLIDQSLEGNYTCGIENEFGRNISPQSITIVALPDPEVVPSNRSFYSEEDSVARLDCSITPGMAISQYYVTWRGAIDETMIFYESYPPRKSSEPFNFDDTRYSIDPHNFSLFIHDVSAADEGDYLCILGVEDPASLMAYQFTVTANTYLSLSTFRTPVFIDELHDQIVTNGTEVIFQCSVLSFPEASHIMWLHKDSLVQRGDDHYRINIVAYTEAKSEIMTNSTLTILNVTGYDSGMVECMVEYFADGMAIVAAIDRSKAALGVLDEVNSLKPVALQTGGYIFTISLKEPLLFPISLRLVYTQAGTGRKDIIRSTTSFFNSSTINYVAFREEIQFDEFQVGVAMEHGMASGPLFSTNDVFSGVGFSTNEIILYGIIVFLGLLLILILVLLLSLLCLWFKTTHTLQSQLKKASLKHPCWKSEENRIDGTASMVPNGLKRKLMEGIIKQLMALEETNTSVQTNNNESPKRDAIPDVLRVNDSVFNEKNAQKTSEIKSRAVGTGIKTNYRGSVGRGQRIKDARSYTLGSKDYNGSIEDRRIILAAESSVIDTSIEIETQDSNASEVNTGSQQSTSRATSTVRMFSERDIRMTSKIESRAVDSGIKSSQNSKVQARSNNGHPEGHATGIKTTSVKGTQRRTSAPVEEGQRISNIHSSSQNIKGATKGSNGTIGDYDTGIVKGTQRRTSAPTEEGQKIGDTIQSSKGFTKSCINNRSIEPGIKTTRAKVTQRRTSAPAGEGQRIGNGSVEDRKTILATGSRITDTVMQVETQASKFDTLIDATGVSTGGSQQSTPSSDTQTTARSFKGATLENQNKDGPRITGSRTIDKVVENDESQRSGSTGLNHLKLARAREKKHVMSARVGGMTEHKKISHTGDTGTPHQAGRKMIDNLHHVSSHSTATLEVQRRSLLENSSALVAELGNHSRVLKKTASQQASDSAASAVPETTGTIAQRASQATGTVLSQRRLSGTAMGKKKAN